MFGMAWPIPILSHTMSVSARDWMIHNDYPTLYWYPPNPHAAQRRLSCSAICSELDFHAKRWWG